jgi:hypothetical protein
LVVHYENYHQNLENQNMSYYFISEFLDVKHVAIIYICCEANYYCFSLFEGFSSFLTTAEDLHPALLN